MRQGIKNIYRLRILYFFLIPIFALISMNKEYNFSISTPKINRWEMRFINSILYSVLLFTLVIINLTTGKKLCIANIESTYDYTEEIISSKDQLSPQNSQLKTHKLKPGTSNTILSTRNPKLGTLNSKPETQVEDDILEGFDNDKEDIDNAINEVHEKPSIFSVSGNCKFGTSYNIAHHKPKDGETDWRGLSRARLEVELDLKMKFPNSWQSFISGIGIYDLIYFIKGRDEFTDDVLDNYEKEYEIGELYLYGSLLENIDIKTGRQIVVWGKSDNIRVTDVLNPLNMREPGMTDIEDLRLPVTMTRLDYYIGDWNLSWIAIHEIRFNKNPEYGSDFYPSETPLPHEVKPAHSLGNTEFAAALNGIFSGWDVSFYWADFYNDMTHMKTASGASSQLQSELEMRHTRLTMYGTAFNIAIGSILIKAEAAYFNGFKFLNSTDSSYSRTDIMAGIEYSGLSDTKISFEAVNRHINEFNNALKNPPDNASEYEFQSVVRISRDFFNETLKATILASTFGWLGSDGAFQRLSIEYKVTDDIEISGGVVFYKSGDLTIFNNIGDNDRFFIEIKYSF